MSASLHTDIEAGLLAAIADAEALEGVSRTRPEAFLEQKDGLVRKLKDVYADLRDGAVRSAARRQPRTTTFQPGAIAQRGRVIHVERRRGA